MINSNEMKSNVMKIIYENNNNINEESSNENENNNDNEIIIMKWKIIINEIIMWKCEMTIW